MRNITDVSAKKNSRNETVHQEMKYSILLHTPRVFKLWAVDVFTGNLQNYDSIRGSVYLQRQRGLSDRVVYLRH